MMSLPALVPPLLVTRRRFLVSACASVVAFQCANGSVSAAEAEDISRRLLDAAPALGERAIGSGEAPIAVVEYASATCPHCAIFHKLVWPQIKTRYIDTGKVRWIFREFPLDELAMAAFMLARCASPDQYFPIIGTLFARQKDWAYGPGKARTELATIMIGFGMDGQSFDACLQRKDLAEGIYLVAKTANTEFAVKATPTFFVDGRMMTGAQEFATFQALFESDLSKKLP